MYHHKTIRFNMDKEEDRLLWDMLSQLPHGSFSEGTKAYWRNVIKIAEEENSPERKRFNEFHDRLFRLENPWYAEYEKMKEEKK